MVKKFPLEIFGAIWQLLGGHPKASWEGSIDQLEVSCTTFSWARGGGTFLEGRHHH